MSYIETTGETVALNGFTRRKGGDIMDASRQWASRPADERVMTIDDLVSRTRKVRETSRDKAGVDWSSLSVEASGNDLALVGKGGVPALFNNWALTQFCGLPIKDGMTIAPQAFLARLSTPIAAAVLQDRLRKGVGRVKPANLLVKTNGALTLRSITTDAYERVWDHDLAVRLAGLCQRGTWQPAEAFRTASGRAQHAWGEPEPLPLGWVGDRSMFVTLVDYEGSVEWNGNRYARFLMLSNSEVGAASLKVVFGLVDFVCCNFIFWGCQEVYEANLRHTKSVHERWSELSVGLSRQLTSGARDEITSGIDVASKFLLGDNEAEVIAVTRAVTELPAQLVQDAYTRTLQTDRYGRPGSAWAMLQGLTEASQHVDTAKANVDKRVDIDAKASRLMAFVKSKS